MQEKDFETPDGARPPMDVAEFYDSLETKRMARLDGLGQQYNSIESLLIKVRIYLRPVGHRVILSPSGQTGVESPWGSFLLKWRCWPGPNDTWVNTADHFCIFVEWVFAPPLVGNRMVAMPGGGYYLPP